MKKHLLIIIMSIALLVSGCATVMTQMTNINYRDAPLVLTYSASEIIRNQNAVATLILPGAYGLTVNGTPIKKQNGAFNKDLRISKSFNTSSYIVDLLPGTHNLTILYDGIDPGSNTPDLHAGSSVGNATVTGSYSGPSLFSWDRSSETSHTVKGGEIYVVGLKMLTITGDMDLYPLAESDRNTIIELRNKAQF